MGGLLPDAPRRQSRHRLLHDRQELPTRAPNGQNEARIAPRKAAL